MHFYELHAHCGVPVNPGCSQPMRGPGLMEEELDPTGCNWPSGRHTPGWWFHRWGNLHRGGGRCTKRVPLVRCVWLPNGVRLWPPGSCLGSTLERALAQDGFPWAWASLLSEKPVAQSPPHQLSGAVLTAPQLEFKTRHPLVVGCTGGPVVRCSSMICTSSSSHSWFASAVTRHWGTGEGLWQWASAMAIPLMGL